jgi:hypothetical protein
MSDWAYAGWLTETALGLLLTTPPASFNWMILEAVDEVMFDGYHSAIDLSRYDNGRVFGTDGEVRWQRDEKKFHVLLVGSIAQPPTSLVAYSKELPANLFEYKRRRYYLWGEWTDNLRDWVEASVPHIFNYPTPPSSGRWRYALTTIEYVNRITGEMEFYRFVGTDMEKL